MLADKHSPVVGELILKRASKDKIMELVSMAAGTVSETLCNNKKMLLDEKTSIYVIDDREEEKETGFVCISDYPRLENSKELRLHFKNKKPEDFHIKDILSRIVGLLSEDKTVDNIFIKIEKNDSRMEKIVESLGFLKDGLFISNQNGDREFSYFSVFKYKLI
ncbi:MAG: hypothetical protein QMB63_01515 [Clostridiaceae bacterium]